MRGLSRKLVAAACVALVAVAVAACGSDDSKSADVTLGEWVIKAPSSLDAGEVTFEARNVGGEPHELVVVRGRVEDLVVKPDGSVDESAFDESDEVGEVEDIAAGETGSLKADLEAGEYVLLCNLVDENEGEAHYAEGMVTTFTVR